MKRDAHYYAMLAFSRACGFRPESAHELAFASQFVNDAKIDYMTFDGDVPKDLDYTVNGRRPVFSGMATSHSAFRLESFTWSSMIETTTAFHFVPGCKGSNFVTKLRCMEESPVILTIVREAMAGEDLMRLGIALHAYADSFTHQGFSGVLSAVNNIRDLKWSDNVELAETDDIIEISQLRRQNGNEQYRSDAGRPSYGHDQALEYPDIPCARWSCQCCVDEGNCDAYISTGTIDNHARFRRAFEKIQDLLEMYVQRHRTFVDLSMDYGNYPVLYHALLYDAPFAEREKNWRKVIVHEDLFETRDPTVKYDEDRWLKASFTNYSRRRFNKRTVHGAVPCRGFAKSPWYRFYRAVRWYKERFFDYCSQFGLDIPR